MNKENKSKLEALLKKVAHERDLEIYDLNIQTNQNPTVIKIIIKKNNGEDISAKNIILRPSLFRKNRINVTKYKIINTSVR